MTTRKILTSYDFTSNPLLGVVLEKLASAPSSPVAGRAYYNTTSNTAMMYNGTAWRPFDAAALTDGSIPLSALNNLTATVQGYRLDQFAAPNVDVSWNTHKITNLVDPTGAQDAATKNYVDGAVQSAAAGIDSKPSVRLVAAANITLSGTQTIDSVSAVAGDRVLATAQTTASQNGVYVVASGAWTRAADADQTGEVTPGAFWFVEEGTTYGKTQWRCNNTGTITLGTTAITIVQFGAASNYSAGNGLSLTGSVFAVVPGAGILADGTSTRVDTSVVARAVSGTITCDGSTTSFALTHSLSKNVIVQVFDSSGVLVEVGVTRTSTSVVTVDFAVAPANTTTYAYTIVG